jgi:hypothetical protein
MDAPSHTSSPHSPGCNSTQQDVARALMHTLGAASGIRRSSDKEKLLQGFESGGDFDDFCGGSGEGSGVGEHDSSGRMTLVAGLEALLRVSPTSVGTPDVLLDSLSYRAFFQLGTPPILPPNPAPTPRASQSGSSKTQLGGPEPQPVLWFKKSSPKRSFSLQVLRTGEACWVTREGKNELSSTVHAVHVALIAVFSTCMLALMLVVFH